MRWCSVTGWKHAAVTFGSGFSRFCHASHCKIFQGACYCFRRSDGGWSVARSAHNCGGTKLASPALSSQLGSPNSMPVRPLEREPKSWHSWSLGLNQFRNSQLEPVNLIDELMSIDHSSYPTVHMVITHHVRHLTSCLPIQSIVSMELPKGGATSKLKVF